MAVIKQPTIVKKDGKPETVEKSVYTGNVRIDREGKTWQKKGVWLREEHLGKLKVIAHFENSPIDKLIDRALETFVSGKLDNSIAIRKLVTSEGDKEPS